MALYIEVYTFRAVGLDLRVHSKFYSVAVRISDVAARSGLPATTLRYYESVGLIDAPRGLNGYRDFDESVLERLAFIAVAKQLGMSLPEIADLLAVVNRDSCTLRSWSTVCVRSTTTWRICRYYATDSTRPPHVWGRVPTAMLPAAPSARC